MDENKALQSQTPVVPDEFEDWECDDEESSVDWAGLAVKLMRHKWFIIIFTAIFTIIGIGCALAKKPRYSVNVVLAPELEGKTTTSSLKGIASMLGMNSLSSMVPTDAINITLFPEICSSTPFLTGLFDVPVTTYVSDKAYMKGKRPKHTTLFKFITKEGEPKKGLSAWLDEILPKEKTLRPENNSVVNISHLTKTQTSVVKLLSKSIGASVDKKTGVTTISVVLEDPQVASDIADTVCQRLQDYVTEYRTRKARHDYDYYSEMAEQAHKDLVKAQAAYAQSVDFDRSVILQTVSSEKERLRVEAQLAQQVFEQLDQQKAAAKAKYQELKPAFVVIQPASMPLRPSGMGRKVLVLAFMFFGFIISAGWKMFVADWVKQFKSDYKQKKAEIAEAK